MKVFPCCVNPSAPNEKSKQKTKYWWGKIFVYSKKSLDYKNAEWLTKALSTWKSTFCRLSTALTRSDTEIRTIEKWRTWKGEGRIEEYKCTWTQTIPFCVRTAIWLLIAWIGSPLFGGVGRRLRVEEEGRGRREGEVEGRWTLERKGSDITHLQYISSLSLCK